MKKFPLALIVLLLVLIGGNYSYGQTTNFTYSGAITNYTVPANVYTLYITCAGAQGGSSTGSGTHAGGYGAIMNGTVAVTPGQVLTILVGGAGASGYQGGGGGGSFVTTAANAAIVVAGGGGGGYYGAGSGLASYANASTSTTANPGVDGNTSAVGGAAGTGTGGGGVAPQETSFEGAGGGGLTGNGTTSPGGGAAAVGGKSFTNGGAGGAGDGCVDATGSGGFGGGGGSDFCSWTGSGGGGGYNGGGGGTYYGVGGGGSSYINGTLASSSATNTGNGYINITACTTPTITQTPGTGGHQCTGSNVGYSLANYNGTATWYYDWTTSSTGATQGWTNWGQGSVGTVNWTCGINGVYNELQVYVTNTVGSCVANSNTVAVVVDAASVAGTMTQTPASGGQVCSGSSVGYSLTGSTGTPYWYYSWSQGGTGTGWNAWGSFGTSYSWASGINGVYNQLQVYATVTNGVCAAASTNSVIVTMDAINTQPAGGQTVCVNGTFTPLSVVANGTGNTYQWYRVFSNTNTGGDAISGATNASYSPPTLAASRTYFYCTVGGVCTSNASGAEVVDQPVATISPATSTVCQGSTLALTASGGSSYQWSGSSSAGTASISAGPGTYTVNATDANNCTASVTKVVTQNLVPSAPAITGNTTICAGLTSQLTVPFTAATGGNISTYNGYTIHAFPGVGTTNFVTNTALNAQVLVVGGGGGGANSIGGGGGGGAVVYESSQPFAASTTYAVNVGAGGAGGTGSQVQGTNGTQSSIGTIGVVAAGGGGGGYFNDNSGKAGGSGGGAGGSSSGFPVGGAASPASSSLGTGGTGTIYGNAGGSEVDIRGGFTATSAGGGGGAGYPALNNETSDPNANRSGGAGIAFNFSGTTYYFGGGGGAGTYGITTINNNGGLGGGGGGASTAGTGGAGDANGLNAGGAGGSGANTNGGNGGANTGGGGGGGSWSSDNGGTGGSGIVLIIYPTISGGTWATDNGAVATVNSATGLVTAQGAGPCHITYTPNSCGVNGTAVSTLITVNQDPAVAVTPTSATSYCSYANSSVLTATPSLGAPGYTYVWSNGLGTGNTASPTLTTGTSYGVTVTDTKGCTASAATGVVTIDAVTSSPSPASNTMLCSYATNGALGAGASGGTGPYSYSWNNGLGTSSTATPIITSATVYTVLVTDANNCTVSKSTGAISIDALVTSVVSPTSTTTYCPYATANVLTVTAGGGTGVYTYAWSGSLGSGTTATPSSTSSTVYTATVTDNNGCSAAANTGSVNVDPAIVVSPTPNVNTVYCSYQVTGAMHANASGGSTIFTYNWSNTLGTASTATPSVINSSTVYSVTVTDSKNCTASANTGSVFVDPLLTAVPTPTAATFLCSYQNGGTLAAGQGGGNSPYTYLWSNGLGTGQTATPTVGASTAYTVTVTDNKSCTVSASTGVITVNPVVTSVPTPTAATFYCAYPATIANALAAVAGGGTSPYTYNWSNSLGTAANATPIIGTAQAYTVTVTDHNNCTVSASTGTITVDPTLTANPTSTGVNSGGVTYVCSYSNTNAFAAGAAGGTPGYTYLWSNSLGTGANATPTITSSTTYGVTVTDTKNCTASGSLGPVQDYSPPTITSTTPGSICGTGTVNLGASASAGTVNWWPASTGGTPPSSNTGNSYTTPIISTSTTFYVDATSFGCTTLSRTSVLATVYPTVISAGGFYYSTSATFTPPTQGIQVPSTNPVNAGIVDQSISGLLPCVTYYYVTYIVTNGDTVYAPTAKGQFTTSTSNATLTLTSGSLNQSVCYPGTITTTTYNVGGGGTGATITGLPTGITGFYSGGVVTISGTCSTPGSYHYTIQTTGTCAQTSVSGTITINALPTFTASGTNVTCNGSANGQITVNVTTGQSPYTYSVNGGTSYPYSASPITGLAPNTYSVLVKDANTCIAATPVSVTITQPTVLNAPVIAGTDILCYGLSDGTATVTTLATGGTSPYQYEITGGSYQTGTSFTGLVPYINYTVVAKDAHGCVSPASNVAVLSQPNPLGTPVIQETNVLCNGAANGTVYIYTVPNGGTTPYQYSLNGGTYQSGTTFSGLAPNNYTVVCQDANGCLSSTSNQVTVTQPAVLTAATIATTVNVSCNGAGDGTVTVTAIPTGGTSPYQYSLNGGAYQSSTVFSGLTPNSYTVVSKDANGCISAASNSVSITQPNTLSAATITETNALCNGSSTGIVTVSTIPTGGTSPYQYSLNGGTYQTSTTFGGLAPQVSYSVVAKDAHGCISSASNSVTVGQPAVLTAATITPTGISCNGAGDGIINVNTIPTGGTSPYQYSLDGGAYQSSTTFSGLAPYNNYTVVAKDANGCISAASNSAAITQPNVLGAATVTATDITCNGGNDGKVTVTTIPVGGTAPFTYSLNGGAYQSSTVFANLPLGSYTVVTTDAHGCISAASNSVTVGQPAATTATASNYGPFVDGQTITVLASSAGAVSYAWSGPGGYSASGTPATRSGATNAMSGVYTVTATTAQGCTATASTTVTVATTAIYTWTGATNTDWTNPANWVPTAPFGGPNYCAIDVIIPSVTHNPVINSTISVGNVQINGNAQLTLNGTGSNINVCKNWTGGTGTSASIIGTGMVILNGSAAQTISGYTQMNELQLDNAAGATMQANSALDIYTSLDLPTGNFNATNGTLTFKSNTVDSVGIIDNFSPNYTGTLTGNVVAERYYATSFTLNQHYMGSPINSPSIVTQFGATGNHAGQVDDPDCNELQSAPQSNYGTVFSMDQVGGSLCGIMQWYVVLSGNAQNGVGYSLLKPGNGKLVLNGQPNLSSNYQISGLYNSGWSNVTMQGRPQISGWKLLSNPYLATLNLSTVPAGFDNQIQVWNDNGPYAGTYQAGLIGTDAVIAPFQGFMVHKTVANGNGLTYTINASDRVRTPTEFFQQNANELKIIAANTETGLLDQTMVAFNSAATDTFDAQYDAQKMGGSLFRHTIYTVNNNEWMSHNVLHSEATTSTVPMGFEPGKTGNFSLAFNGVNTFDPTSYIYLEDKAVSNMYNVRNGNYVFSADSADAWDRFVLHFTPPTAITTIDATCTTGGSINLQQQGIAYWNYSLADANSNVISHGVLNETAPATIPVAAGSYTLTLTDTNNYVAVKAIQVNGPVGISAGFLVSADTVQPSQTIAVTATTSGAASYEWNFGNGTTASGNEAMVSYTEPGVYVLTLLVTNDAGCSSTQSHSITVTKAGATGLNNISGTGDISIWSNANKVFVDFTSVQDVDATVAIYNVLGQEISNEHYTNSNVYQKEIDHIEAAYMIVMVRNADKITTRKVLITNSK